MREVQIKLRLSMGDPLNLIFRYTECKRRMFGDIMKIRKCSEIDQKTGGKYSDLQQKL